MEEKTKEIIKVLSVDSVRQFLLDHENDDEKKLVLKHKTILGLPAAIIAEQIAARRKANEKLPTYFSTPNIIYPPGINLEQSSSERTARFKAELLQKLDHTPQESIRSNFKIGVDLTGGFGIDTLFLSKIFSQFHYVEPNINLLEIARHNHAQLGALKIAYHNTTAEIFLREFVSKADMIFIDPSRRSENKKVFNFKDSEPDIASLQSKIYEKTDLLLIKASPLLDINLGQKELSFVKKICVLALENEVKELLFLNEKRF